MKLPENEATSTRGVAPFFTDEKAINDYYPFGMAIAERSYQTSGYRYGFGGHELDNEVSGTGNHLAFGDYGYDTRTGRRWNIEPLIKKYASNSSYMAYNNNPIIYQDPDGRDFEVIKTSDQCMIFVQNVYTTTIETYNQALAGASLWNKLGPELIDGVEVTVQVNVTLLKIDDNRMCLFEDTYGVVADDTQQEWGYTRIYNDAYGNYYAGKNSLKSHEVEPDKKTGEYVKAVTDGGNYIYTNIFKKTKFDFGNDCNVLHMNLVINLV